MTTSNYEDKIKDFVIVQKDKQKRLKRQEITILKFIEKYEKDIRLRKNKH